MQSRDSQGRLQTKREQPTRGGRHSRALVTNTTPYRKPGQVARRGSPGGSDGYGPQSHDCSRCPDCTLYRVQHRLLITHFSRTSQNSVKKRSEKPLSFLQGTKTVQFGPFWPRYTDQIYARSVTRTPFQTVSTRSSHKAALPRSYRARRPRRGDAHIVGYVMRQDAGLSAPQEWK
jgi:hypothetical protein